jgi:hypothetical protein
MKLASFILSLMLALGFVFMYASDSHAVLKDGLVAYYSFNDGTAKDNSGNGNNGKIIGAPKSVAGKTGNCLDFNGKTDAIDVPDSKTIQLPDALTVAAWINVRAVDATVGDHGGIVWKGEMIGWGTREFNYRIAVTTGPGLTWGTCNATAENYFATAIDLTMGKWIYVCMTADGTTAIGYVSKDGKTLTKPTSAESNPKPSPKPYNVWAGQPLRIGYAQGYGGALADLRYFNGLIDEVVLYNRALSEAEIIELMSANLATTAVEASDKVASTWGDLKIK